MANIQAKAILFDMDGTLVNSAAGVEGAWQLFKESYPHIDVKDILSSSHGIRTVENLRNYCGITEDDELEREALRFEEAIVSSSVADGRPGILLLPGVKPVIDKLVSRPRSDSPNPIWAICTSATRAYATSALTSAGIPIPDVFVAAEDVKRGKPSPDPYLLGAQKCGTEPINCIVFEDAPNGILSGKAAGCITVGFVTTHSLKEVKAAQPDYIVHDMASVSMDVTPEGLIEVTIDNQL